MEFCDLIEKSEENPASHNYAVGKGNIVIAFFFNQIVDILWYYTQTWQV